MSNTLFFSLHSDDCSCTDSVGYCIMDAQTRADFEPTSWSSCSVGYLNDGFDMHNLNRCLGNQPTMMVGDPVCGNGIREGDEVCDCGSASECTDPCCNANTCQLATGAQCSAGECCTSQCMLQTADTVCRAAIGSCDITEYCTESSGECPSDEVLLDGTSCSINGEAAYCYSGVCPSNNQLCQEAWSTCINTPTYSY